MVPAHLVKPFALPFELTSILGIIHLDLDEDDDSLLTTWRLPLKDKVGFREDAKVWSEYPRLMALELQAAVAKKRTNLHVTNK